MIGKKNLLPELNAVNLKSSISNQKERGILFNNSLSKAGHMTLKRGSNFTSINVNNPKELI